MMASDMSWELTLASRTAGGQSIAQHPASQFQRVSGSAEANSEMTLDAKGDSWGHQHALFSQPVHKSERVAPRCRCPEVDAALRRHRRNTSDRQHLHGHLP